MASAVSGMGQYTVGVGLWHCRYLAWISARRKVSVRTSVTWTHLFAVQCHSTRRLLGLLLIELQAERDNSSNDVHYYFDDHLGRHGVDQRDPPAVRLMETFSQEWIFIGG